MGLAMPSDENTSCSLLTIEIKSSMPGLNDMAATRPAQGRGNEKEARGDDNI